MHQQNIGIQTYGENTSGNVCESCNRNPSDRKLDLLRAFFISCVYIWC